MRRLAGKVAIISSAAHCMREVTARLFAREGAKILIGNVASEKAKL
jgi:NAD(P)-dependent dehydrogenase (short-subunit alcohol dehydrogenase family)